MYSFPRPTPLERLLVQDGLLLNADFWRTAHQYHRDRTNLHYQSLHEPGIVCGLGVSVINAPNYAPAQYRDYRWIRIHPGIAIDLNGNLIIVSAAIDFRIASEVQDESITIYIVVSYVDPEKLQHKPNQNLYPEVFRIDEKTNPPHELEIEICRIHLAPGNIMLGASIDVFNPNFNQLDVRFRKAIRLRPEGIVRVAVISEQLPDTLLVNIRYLLRSIEGLYPGFRGEENIGQFEINNLNSDLFNYDILILTQNQFYTLNSSQIEFLKQYCDIGGNILVEIGDAETDIDELSSVKQQLEEAISEIVTDPDLRQMLEQLEWELVACNQTLDAAIKEVSQQVETFAKLIIGSSRDLVNINFLHPIKIEPFLFSILPSLRKKPIQILNSGGFILVIGDLSPAWGLDSRYNLSRETIRAAQELGINILYFAWRRREMTRLQKIGV